MAQLVLLKLLVLSSLFIAGLKLAASNGTYPPASSYHRGILSSDNLPKWISAADRRLLQSPPTIEANLVVAQDCSGNYKTISEAVAASVKLRGTDTNRRFVIHVKAGTYKEYVRITKAMPNLMLIGDDINATIVTGSRNMVDSPHATLTEIATFAILGEGFICQYMTFQNTAGPVKEQAIALMSQSNHSVFYRCSFDGYQDTLYLPSNLQFYRECDIYGTIDFIFGDAAAVFQECNIRVRRPNDGQKNTVTAHGRTNPTTPSGFTIQDSVVEADQDLIPVQGYVETYLGRPWKDYSTTVFINTTLGNLIHPAGWLEWKVANPSRLDTLYYAEYMNTGLGASTANRVKWSGYHKLTTSEAQRFTVKNFLFGDSWIPATGVPYKSDL